MNPAIETRELCYTYEDGTAALDHVSLKAERGRITGILGANGAGKSTLFLNLNGVLTPQSGEVLLDGAPVRRDRKGLAELRRRVGIVFQDPDDQLFSADVYRDISFGAVNLGLPEAEVRRRVEAAMERTGVAHLRDKPTHALSFGQKKRAAIAGVLVMEPEVLILDEPTAGLDPQGVSGLLALLEQLRDGLNMAILLATHDMDLVPRMPILLAEKMGPHIAIGDPCFARGEDAPVYNLYDHKEMTARENERTARRNEGGEVYTNIHTDITLAFDELERLEGVRADGARTVILEKGRFVLPGTEALNEPLTRRKTR